MKLLVSIPALVMCVILSGVARAQSVTVDDSGFETPAVTGLPIIGTLLGGVDYYSYSGLGNTYLTGTSGWYVSPTSEGVVTLVNQGLLGLVVSPVTNNSSGQYLVLNGLGLNVLNGQLVGGTTGGISQVISTTPGQMYQVNYLAAALRVDALTTTDQAVLNAGVDGVTVTSPSGGALLNLDVGTFNSESFTFTATGTSSTLDFYEPTALLADVGGVAIDNVSVTAVPEPSHYAIILIAGVMLISIWRRRREANEITLPKLAEN